MGDEQAFKVRIYHVPQNHRGATERLLREAAALAGGPDFSKIIYIAPADAKLREAQKTFHKIAGRAYIPPGFFTLRRLAGRLFDSVSPGRRLPGRLVPLILSEISGQGIGYSVALASLLKDLKQYHPSKETQRIREELNALFDSLGIPSDASIKLNEALDSFERYKAILSDSSSFDDDDIMAIAAGMDMNFINAGVIVADGIVRLTAAEMELFSALATNAACLLAAARDSSDDQRSDCLTGLLKARFDCLEEVLPEDKRPDCRYVRYGGAEEEIEGVARHIKSLFIAGRVRGPDQVTVVFPDLSVTAGLALRVFRRYGLPASISSGTPLMHLQGIRDFLCLIESVADDFPRTEFASFLMSGRFRAVPEGLRRIAPSLSLKSGIIKGRDAWEQAHLLIEDKDVSSSVRDDISAVFKMLEKLINMGKTRVRAVTALVRKTVHLLGFAPGHEVQDILEKALDTVSLLDRFNGGRPVSLREYLDMLRHILAGAEEGDDEGTIRMIGFRDSRGLEPDHLYFCGLKDGEMPSKPPVDHLLPDSVRKAYGLTDLKTYLADQKADFFRLIGSSGSAHLSYAAADGDRISLPSSYLPWKGELTEQTYGILSVEELQTQKGGSPLASSISEVRTGGKGGSRLPGMLKGAIRVTDIDNFRRCPRRFFIERVLGLRASERADFEVEAAMLGTIIHRIMEELIMLPLDTVAHKAPSLVETVLSNHPLDPLWKGIIAESFLEMLPDIVDIESEMRAEGCFPHATEMAIQEEALPGITLKGKIDRIDRCNGSFRIIDYKTGHSAVGSDIIRKGKDLQLPLYAAMLRAKGMTVEKAGIYSLREIGIKWIPTKKDKHSFDDYVAAALDFLGRTAEEMRSGAFPARPMEEFLCHGCAEAPFCPYIHAEADQ